MQSRISYKHFNKAIVCLLFLFSFLFSFSAPFNDHHIYTKIEDQTSIDADDLNYSEYTLSPCGHLSESPENPAEGDTNVALEKENEKEKEKDDDRDGFSGNQSLQEINSVLLFQKGNFYRNVFLLSDGTIVPYYILFHSWKSFLA